MTTSHNEGNHIPASLVHHSMLRHYPHLQVAPSAETQALYEQMQEHDVPALPTVYANNLPQALSSFVGREREIEAIRHLLRDVGTNGRASVRLLTLTGAGGCGKTHLALKISETILRDYPDGVWWVDLASQSDSKLVAQSVATALNLREASHRSIDQQLEERFGTKQALLVLDNCEHLIDACAQLVRALLRASPHLQILATSREALGIEGETIWLLVPMPVPDHGPLPALKILQQFESVSLFIERAHAGYPNFTLTHENAEAVARICRQVEGLPLAIELAAARLKALSVEEIAERLTENFQLPTGSSRTLTLRHQPLSATIDRSYRLR